VNETTGSTRAPEPETVTLEHAREGDVVVLEVAGKLIIGHGDVLLRAKLQELLDAGGLQFVLDVTRVSYMDSAGLGAVASCSKRCRDAGGVLKVVTRPRSKPHTLFKVTGLSRVFEMFADRGAALRSFEP